MSTNPMLAAKAALWADRIRQRRPAPVEPPPPVPRRALPIVEACRAPMPTVVPEPEEGVNAPAPTPPSEVTVPTTPPPKLSREALRSRRKREVRAKTENISRLKKHEFAFATMDYPEKPGVDYMRPAVRGNCAGGPRPCPFVSCAKNLYLDVDPRNGNLKLNFPDLEPDEMKESCALDVAERGGVPGSGLGEGQTLDVVSEMMNLTRERIRQLETKALAKLERRAKHLRPEVERGPIGKRRLPVIVEQDEEDDDEAREDDDATTDGLDPGTG